MTDKVDKQTLQQDLLEGLRISAKLSQDLLQTLKEENKALRGMATQELFRLAKQKNNLLVKIQYLDESLKNTTQGLLSDDDKATAPDRTDSVQGALPLSRLETLLPEEKAETVKQYRRNLHRLRQEIHTQNLINRRFTHDTLACLNDAINLITRPVETNNNYSMPGMTDHHRANNPSLISKKV